MDLDQTLWPEEQKSNHVVATSAIVTFDEEHDSWGKRSVPCATAVILNLGYAYPHGYEPGHLGVREKKIE
jgi:hypothetical protein